MKQNIGSTDGAVRILLGLGLFGFLLFTPSATRWWGLLGFVPLLTAFVGSCPLYSLMGIDTRGSGERHYRR
ncbi:DUF2892 domain-containing protein [Povalibacter sp.]|uniref:YgaP family membrane protein n=1 Tax=Povalibacter sp. TaxID=1962978 RepID=UPI002F3EFC82